MGAFKDFVKGGHDSEDWVDAFEMYKDVIAPPDKVYSYDPESLVAGGFGSARSDAPTLQTEPVVENNWFGVKGRIDPKM